MITGKEYLKENMENTNIPEEHYTNEIGEMMEWYADDYHKELVKKLTIPVVTQRSELFFAVLKWAKQADLDYPNDMLLNDFEKYEANNCG